MNIYQRILAAKLWNKANPSTLLAFDSNGKKFYLDGDECRLDIIKPQPLHPSLGGKIRIFAPLAGLASAVIPSLINISVSAVRQRLKKISSQFTAEYEVNQSASGFYYNKNILLPILEIIRTIKKADGQDEVASKFVFQPELSPDGISFRYRFSEYMLKYSKARTMKEFNKLKFQFGIELTGNWMDEAGSYQNKLLGSVVIDTPLLPFNNVLSPAPATYFSSWLPIVPPLIQVESKERKEKIVLKTDPEVLYKEEKDFISKLTATGMIDKTTSEITETKTDEKNEKSFFKTTNTAIKEKKVVDNSGNYSIRMVVKEANPYQLRADELNAFFEANEENMAEMVKSIIKKEDPK